MTEQTLEHAVNHWVAQGWQLDGIRLVVTEHSKRPAMAFASFIRGAARRGAARRGAAGGGESSPHVIAADDNDEPEQRKRLHCQWGIS